VLSAIAAPAAPSQQSTSTLRFILQASRPGLWLTAVWFYLLPLGGHYLIDSPAFWLGIVYVSFPLGLLIYGWNDCVDYAADQLNPRKGNILFGARGTKEQLRQLPRWIVLVQVPFAVAFVALGGWKMLGFFAAMSAACFLYNNLNFKARRRSRSPTRPGICWSSCSQAGSITCRSSIGRRCSSARCSRCIRTSSVR
jgi:4-hydroxybenzoate polyprenyltransferase